MAKYSSSTLKPLLDELQKQLRDGNQALAKQMRETILDYVFDTPNPPSSKLTAFLEKIRKLYPPEYENVNRLISYIRDPSEVAAPSGTPKQTEQGGTTQASTQKPQQKAREAKTAPRQAIQSEDAARYWASLKGIQRHLPEMTQEQQQDVLKVLEGGSDELNKYLKKYGQEGILQNHLRRAVELRGAVSEAIGSTGKGSGRRIYAPSQLLKTAAAKQIGNLYVLEDIVNESQDILNKLRAGNLPKEDAEKLIKAYGQRMNEAARLDANLRNSVKAGSLAEVLTDRYANAVKARALLPSTDKIRKGSAGNVLTEAGRRGMAKNTPDVVRSNLSEKIRQLKALQSDIEKGKGNPSAYDALRRKTLGEFRKWNSNPAYSDVVKQLEPELKGLPTARQLAQQSKQPAAKGKEAPTPKEEQQAKAEPRTESKQQAIVENRPNRQGEQTVAPKSKPKPKSSGGKIRKPGRTVAVAGRGSAGARIPQDISKYGIGRILTGLGMTRAPIPESVAQATMAPIVAGLETSPAAAQELISSIKAGPGIAPPRARNILNNLLIARNITPKLRSAALPELYIPPESAETIDDALKSYIFSPTVKQVQILPEEQPIMQSAQRPTGKQSSGSSTPRQGSKQGSSKPVQAAGGGSSAGTPPPLQPKSPAGMPPPLPPKPPTGKVAGKAAGNILTKLGGALKKNKKTAIIAALIAAGVLASQLLGQREEEPPEQLPPPTPLPPRAYNQNEAARQLMLAAYRQRLQEDSARRLASLGQTARMTPPMQPGTRALLQYVGALPNGE